jgi:hypothetical protein
VLLPAEKMTAHAAFKQLLQGVCAGLLHVGGRTALFHCAGSTQQALQCKHMQFETLMCLAIATKRNPYRNVCYPAGCCCECCCRLWHPRSTHLTLALPPAAASQGDDQPQP